MTTIFKLAPWFLILALIAVALWFWKDKESAKADLNTANGTIATQSIKLDTAKAVHNEDVSTINHLTDYKAANDRIEADFMAKFASIEGGFTKLQGNIADLRRSNADVQKYLSTPIPLPLADLLNGVCANAADCSKPRSGQLGTR